MRLHQPIWILNSFFAHNSLKQIRREGFWINVYDFPIFVFDLLQYFDLELFRDGPTKSDLWVSSNEFNWPLFHVTCLLILPSLRHIGLHRCSIHGIDA